MGSHDCCFGIYRAEKTENVQKHDIRFKNA